MHRKLYRRRETNNLWTLELSGETANWQCYIFDKYLLWIAEGLQFLFNPGDALISRLDTRLAEWIS